MRPQRVGVRKLYQLPLQRGDLPRSQTLGHIVHRKSILHHGLGLAPGRDGCEGFCFMGKGRAGLRLNLVAFWSEFGFGVTIAATVAQSEQTVSSTANRRALSEHAHAMPAAICHLAPH